MPTDEKTRFEWPCISGATKKAVVHQLEESISIYDRSGIIEQLENRFSSVYGTKHALLTSSGTAALHSMFVGAGLQEGDEVLCPAYTFFATVTPLFFTGATPALVDCGADGNIDPEDIEHRITDRTRAILVTHMWGLPCNMERITAIAREHDLILLEDASHAHGATYQGKLVGTFGAASALSLQAQKTLPAGEGGVLLTDDDEIFYRALLLGHYNKRCSNEIPKDHPLYQFRTTGMGLKLRIHPLAAAIANQQFDDLERVLAGRRRFARMMKEGLEDLPGITAPEPAEDSDPSWYAFVLQYYPPANGGLSVAEVHARLHAEGFTEVDRPNSTCPLNLHPLFQNPELLFPSYAGKVSYRKGDFPNAERFHEHALKLPVWHRAADEGTVQKYILAFQKILHH